MGANRQFTVTLACGAILALGCSHSSAPTASQEEPSAGNEAPEAPSSGAEATAEVLVLGCVGDGCGGLGAAPSSDERPAAAPATPRSPLDTLPLPEDTPITPGLEAASTPLDHLRALPESLEAASSMDALVAGITQRVQSAAQDMHQVDEACASVDPALISDCATLRADARNLLARWLTTVSVGIPRDMEAQIARLNPDAQQIVREAVPARIHEVLTGRAEPLWCQAAQLYGEANTTRGREQLERYGDAFVAGCP